MKTANDLFAAFEAFVTSATALDATAFYHLELWVDAQCDLFDGNWALVTSWETFDEGVEKLQELTGLNEEANNG